MGLTLLMIKFYSVRVCTHKYVAQNRKSTQLKMTDDRTANFLNKYLLLFRVFSLVCVCVVHTFLY